MWDTSPNALFFDGCKVARRDTKIYNNKINKTEYAQLENFLCLSSDGTLGYSQ